MTVYESTTLIVRNGEALRRSRTMLPISDNRARHILETAGRDPALLESCCVLVTDDTDDVQIDDYCFFPGMRFHATRPWTLYVQKSGLKVLDVFPLPQAHMQEWPAAAGTRALITTTDAVSIESVTDLSANIGGGFTLADLFERR